MNMRITILCLILAAGCMPADSISIPNPPDAGHFLKVETLAEGLDSCDWLVASTRGYPEGVEAKIDGDVAEIVLLGGGFSCDDGFTTWVDQPRISNVEPYCTGAILRDDRGVCHWQCSTDVRRVAPNTCP